MVKERVINLTADEVLALLGDQPVALWRAIKPQPDGVRVSVFVSSGYEDLHGYALYCPFGKAGDRLWGREKWRTGCNDYDGSTNYVCSDVDGKRWEVKDHPNVPVHGAYWQEWHWRSAITMPYWASRLTMEIITVEVERRNGVWGWLLTIKRIVELSNKAA